MAAYAALLSLMRIIEKLHLHPHPPPISLNKNQIHSLTEKISFLEEFLEAYNPHLGYSAEADPLETRIADAAYAAEDVIESNIVDRITNVWPGIIYSYRVYRGLEKVIQDMASIQRDAMDITETMGLQLHHYTKSERRWESKESLRSTSIAPNGRSMVGVDDVLLQIKDKLTSHSRRLQIIPIVGMGGSVFREDEVIRVSKLTRLWVAEGFLKPIQRKSLEEIAKEYLKDLTERNLILIQKKGISGSIKECKIHDLLREFCLREAEKERFYVVARQHGPHQGVTITPRRIVISNSSKKEDIDALRSVSLARSLIWDREESPPSLNLRLLRIFESSRSAIVENMCQLVNSRYLGIMEVDDDKSLSTLNRLWNLETLYASAGSLSFRFPVEIWCMPHIRHVVDCQYHPNNGHIQDPRSGIQNDIVLKNLHTLEGITDFKWSDEAVKRIPNVKKLGITYRTLDGWSCLDNLVRLQKLMSLDCYFWKKMSDSGQSLNFPQSIKKLKLRVVPSDCWQDILEKIGSLPLLEKLVLRNGCFAEGKWETVEG